MSNFYGAAIHPKTGEVQNVIWLDNYFGRHIYGVKFPDGSIFHENEIEVPDVVPAAHAIMPHGLAPELHP